MASAASRVVVNNAKAALPLIRGSLLNRAGANLARSDQKLLLAPAPLLDQASFGQLLKTVDSDRPPAPATAADLLDSRFGFSIQDMRLRPRKEVSDSDEDESDDDDSDDFDDGDELYDDIDGEDDYDSEEYTLSRSGPLNRAGANLARSDQKLPLAPALVLDQASFGQLLKNVDSDRPQAPATAADLLDSRFGFSIQDMRLRPRNDASDSDEDESDDDDSDDFDDDDGELYDDIDGEDDSESEEETSSRPALH